MQNELSLLNLETAYDGMIRVDAHPDDVTLPLDSQVVELVSYKSCLVHQQDDPFVPKVLLDLFLGLAAIT